MANEGTGTGANGTPAAGGTGGGTGGGGAAGAATTQLRTVRQQLVARTTELEQLRGELEAVRAKAETADTLGARIRELEGEKTKLVETHKTERALWATGLTDPDEVELVRFAHGRLPAENRPSLPDWLEGIKKDPAKAPKLLEPITSRWKAPAGKGKDAPATTSRGRPQPNKGTTPADDTGGGGGGEPTPEEWAEARARAIRGDGRLFDELRKRVGRGPYRARRR